MYTEHTVWVQKYKLCIYTQILINSKQVTSTKSNEKYLTQTNTINTLQIRKPKAVTSEQRRTSYKHTLWKLVYTIQDEHMLSSNEQQKH